ncbi:MAG: hypothetical protein ABSA66_18580 [Roseiarcus sp.]|jgi:hypothetical protein
MAHTILMFFVLILSFAAMFGFVKFSENVIARPQAVPVIDDAAARNADRAESL